MDKDTKEKISKYALKPALGGVVNLLWARMIYGDEITGNSVVNVLGMNVNVNAALFGVGAINKVTTELISDYALTQIPHNEKYMKIESALVSMASGAASNYGLMVGLGLSDPTQFIEPMILGALTEGSTSYLYNTFLHDLYMNSAI